MIKFLDLKRQRDAFHNSLDEIILKIIDDGQFISGPQVKALENTLSKYVGSECITVANGTDALSIALMSIGTGPGDEVILPSFTWVSTAEVVSQLGARPVFIDIDDNFVIDIKKLESKINSNTKAIIPVSMFGRCPNLQLIKEIANRYKIITIEDAAQSFGAKSDGAKSCNVLDISTTSFFPSKPLGCYGDGGAIFSKNEELLEKLRVIPKHGQSGRYNYIEIGMNSRLDTIQAAILLEKFNIFEDEIFLRNNIAKLYSSMLSDLLQITTPHVPSENNRSVWAQYTILLDESIANKRKELMQYLKDKGIPTALYYPVPLHSCPIYANYDSSDMTLTNNLANRVLSLPMHPYLSIDEVEKISGCLKDGISKFS
ncbi:MAG: DegT/DnrJ/EryC1/StrS family aminotransferase [Gammaproteobacteria bacterium]